MPKIIFIKPADEYSEAKEYECIGFAMDPFRSGWEWYAFELVEGTVYFGLVHGFETEFGNFCTNELAENKIRFRTDYEYLKDIMPPVGWSKKA